MDRLWTPWRYAYITGTSRDPAPGVPPSLGEWLSVSAQREHADCVFCNMIGAVDYGIVHQRSEADVYREALIVYRGPHTFICLNRFPYSNGHLLIVPYEHCASLAGLAPEIAQEVMSAAQRAETALRRVYHPDGLNFGLNLGEAAGAGVASHMHLHALPRWSGDTNFMTVTAETRILPETLEVTWKKLRDALMDGFDASTGA